MSNHYRTLQLEIGNLIESTGLELYPEMYKGNISLENLFGRYSFSINDNEKSDFGNGHMLRGILFIRIFFKNGEGDTSAINFADNLSSIFDNYKSGSLSFEYSNFSQPTEDPDNEALSMMVWQISFSKYV